MDRSHKVARLNHIKNLLIFIQYHVIAEKLNTLAQLQCLDIQKLNLFVHLLQKFYFQIVVIFVNRKLVEDGRLLLGRIEEHYDLRIIKVAILRFRKGVNKLLKSRYLHYKKLARVAQIQAARRKQELARCQPINLLNDGHWLLLVF